MKAILFQSRLGWIGLAWSPKGLRASTFPRETEIEAREELQRKVGIKLSFAKRVPPELRSLIERDPALFAKAKSKLDLTEREPHAKLFAAIAKIPRGETATLDEIIGIARWSEGPTRAQEIIAQNPWPLLVPCHRVQSAKSRTSAVHRRLLEHEDVVLGPPRLLPRETASAIAELLERDPQLKTLFAKSGEFKLKRASRTTTPFSWLTRSIIYQQLHGKAAGTIHARLKANFAGRDPEPRELAKLSDEKMREAGLSRQKIAALRDLTRAAEVGLVPDRTEIRKLSDAEIIKRLTQIRGVGRWTVEMLLIFGLGRADIVAFDDFAIRKAIVQHYNLPEPLNREAFQSVTSAWKPWRSIVSWYLWRSLDGPPAA